MGWKTAAIPHNTWKAFLTAVPLVMVWNAHEPTGGQKTAFSVEVAYAAPYFSGSA